MNVLDSTQKINSFFLLSLDRQRRFRVLSFSSSSTTLWCQGSSGLLCSPTPGTHLSKPWALRTNLCLERRHTSTWSHGPSRLSSQWLYWPLHRWGHLFLLFFLGHFWCCTGCCSSHKLCWTSYRSMETLLVESALLATKTTDTALGLFLLQSAWYSLLVAISL